MSPISPTVSQAVPVREVSFETAWNRSRFPNPRARSLLTQDRKVRVDPTRDPASRRFSTRYYKPSTNTPAFPQRASQSRGTPRTWCRRLEEPTNGRDENGQLVCPLESVPRAEVWPRVVVSLATSSTRRSRRRAFPERREV